MLELKIQRKADCVVTFNELQCTSFITKTGLFKYIENFTTKKGKFSDKNSDIFHIPAQNIVCGYPLELPQ